MERIVIKRENSKLNHLIVVMLLLSTSIYGYDLIYDFANELKQHFFIELFSFLLLIVVSYIFVISKIKNDDYVISIINKKENELKKTKRANEALLAGIYQKIIAKFLEWQFTKTEIEIALLLIKGFSIKEIANLRGNSDRTISEHARSIYHKAKVIGRAELAAFFLEDIL